MADGSDWRGSRLLSLSLPLLPPPLELPGGGVVLEGEGGHAEGSLGGRGVWTRDGGDGGKDTPILWVRSENALIQGVCSKDASIWGFCSEDTSIWGF